MNCPNCNAALRDGARFCPKCGTPVSQQQVPTYGSAPQSYQTQPYQPQAQQPYQDPTQQSYQDPTQQPYQDPTQQSYAAPAQQPYQVPAPQTSQNMAPQAPNVSDPAKTKAIASLVCGIVGVVFDFLFATVLMPAIGCILGIVGITMASNARKLGFTGGMATGGLVCSIIAVVFGVGSLLCVLCVGGAVGGIAGSLGTMSY